jgi:hypothetical protein
MIQPVVRQIVSASAWTVRRSTSFQLADLDVAERHAVAVVLDADAPAPGASAARRA